MTTTGADAPAPPDPADVAADLAVARPAQGLSGIAIAGLALAGAAVLLVTLNARQTGVQQPLLATTGTAKFAPPPALPFPRADAATATVRPFRPTAYVPSDGGPMSVGPMSLGPMSLGQRDGDRPMARWGSGGDASRYAPMSPGSTGMPPAGSIPPPYVPGQSFGAAMPAPATGNADANSALVIDIGRDPADRPGGTPEAGAGAGAGPGAAANRPIRATLIANRSSLVAEGAVFNATLETAIDSTRPGLIRAIVGEDVRGFDGRRVLIPRGSRLIGEYRADVQNGQRRVLATWTRLIRPDGVAVRIDSPAADSVGGTGIPGQVHSNFLQRFASAVLQSALNVGVNLASRTNGSTVIIGSAGGNVSQVLPAPEARRSIRVPAGNPVSVFVAHDLDFSDVPGWR